MLAAALVVSASTAHGETAFCSLAEGSVTTACVPADFDAPAPSQNQRIRLEIGTDAGRETAATDTVPVRRPPEGLSVRVNHDQQTVDVILLAYGLFD